MRFLLSRTDALGDLIVSLPVQERILSRQPEAEIHWLVRPYAGPLLEGIPGIAGIHLREEGTDLLALIRRIGPDAVLNFYHHDRAVTLAAQRAGVRIRVARARGFDQIRAATHLLWKGRHHTGRHEAQNVLDFLHPWGWEGGWPVPPKLVVSGIERALGEEALAQVPHPRLGIVTRSSGSSASPSAAWWDAALPVLREAGWNPIILAPPECSDLEKTDLRGLLGRIAACDVFAGPSTGPLHMAAALGIPVLALMGQSPHRGPSRWTPLGQRVQVLQYPGHEADLSGGMDRLDPHQLLPHLERLQ